MEKALKNIEQRFRKLVELSPVSISEYRDGRFLYVNPAGLHMMGIDRLEDVIGTDPMYWIHPDDKPKAKEFMDKALLHDDSLSCDYRIVCPNGNIADLSVTASYDLHSQTVQLVCKDITERKQTERALRESEELNRKLVELSPEAIFLHSDYKFDFVNPAGLAMLGATSMDDIIGKPVLDRIHPRCKEEARLRLSAIYDLNLSTSSLEQRLLRYDGTAFDSDLVAVPIIHNGENSSLSLIRDVSDRKIVEEERKITEEMIRQSEERYSSLQTSVDRIFHDLFGVMKVSEMERRLIKEVKEVIKVSDVSLIHVDLDNNFVVKNDCDTLPNSYQEKLLKLSEIPVCKLMDTDEGHLLKIAEIRGKSYVLWIGDKPDSLRIAPNRVWLQTIARYVSVLFDNVRLIEDLTNELEHTASNLIAPSWLLRLLFNLSENERKHLSQDLHDGALQEQIIW
jgi:two-component system sensor histidine kinase ComP